MLTFNINVKKNRVAVSIVYRIEAPSVAASGNARQGAGIRESAKRSPNQTPTGIPASVTTQVQPVPASVALIETVRKKVSKSTKRRRSFSGPPEATEQTTAASPTLRPTPVKRQKIHHQEQSEPEPESEQESVPDSDMEQVSDMETPSAQDTEGFTEISKKEYKGPRFRISYDAVYYGEGSLWFHVLCNGRDFILNNWTIGEDYSSLDKRDIDISMFNYTRTFSKDRNAEEYAGILKSFTKRKTKLHEEHRQTLLFLTRKAFQQQQ